MVDQTVLQDTKLLEEGRAYEATPEVTVDVETAVAVIVLVATLMTVLVVVVVLLRRPN